MEFIKSLLDVVLHLDRHLNEYAAQFGIWLYIILFGIIFAETGLVVTPFLPGDSLLFAVGALAASPGSVLNVHLVVIVLTVAAILGDTVNYWAGKKFGPAVFRSESSRWLNKKHIERTHRFYEKYGGKTVILARFVPIVRTFAPFVAGIGAMSYAKFILYNIIGAILWVTSMTYLGYLFGNIPIVKKNFTLVALGIVFVSILPALYEIAREWLAGRKSVKEGNGG
jgi:membrane-associated protein